MWIAMMCVRSSIGQKSSITDDVWCSGIQDPPMHWRYPANVPNEKLKCDVSMVSTRCGKSASYRCPNIGVNTLVCIRNLTNVKLGMFACGWCIWWIVTAMLCRNAELMQQVQECSHMQNMASSFWQDGEVNKIPKLEGITSTQLSCQEAHRYIFRWRVMERVNNLQPDRTWTIEHCEFPKSITQRPLQYMRTHKQRLGQRFHSIASTHGEHERVCNTNGHRRHGHRRHDAGRADRARQRTV